MQKPSLLQISFCISILVHAVLFGALKTSGFFVSKPTLEPGDNLVTLNLVAAPVEFVAPSPMVKVVAPVQPLPPEKPIDKLVEKPVEKPVPIEPLKQPPPPEPPPVIPIPQPVQVAVVAKPVVQAQPLPQKTDFHGDASSVKSGADAITVQAQSDVEAKPDYLKNPLPDYPELARRRHEEGVVLLAVKVTAQGRAASVEIKKSSGFPLLDDAAVEAVRDYKFNPVLALEPEIEWPIGFKLR
jgi:periplasmic protein TonB